MTSIQRTLDALAESQKTVKRMGISGDEWAIAHTTFSRDAWNTNFALIAEWARLIVERDNSKKTADRKFDEYAELEDSGVRDDLYTAACAELNLCVDALDKIEKRLREIEAELEATDGQ